VVEGVLTVGETPLERVVECGVIAIVRLRFAASLSEVANAIRSGGIDVIEVSLTTPEALDMLREGVRELGDDVLFGAGTVLDAETARAAILAGARFIVTPTLAKETIAICKRYGVVSIPGALSPTEILTAWESGADLVKVFPATVGGPQYIRDVLAPLPQVKLVPTGGIELANAAAFIRAGATALGVSSSLVDPEAVRCGDFGALTKVAQAFQEAVSAARTHE